MAMIGHLVLGILEDVCSQVHRDVFRRECRLIRIEACEEITKHRGLFGPVYCRICVLGWNKDGAGLNDDEFRLSFLRLSEPTLKPPGMVIIDVMIKPVGDEYVTAPVALPRNRQKLRHSESGDLQILSVLLKYPPETGAPARDMVLRCEKLLQMQCPS